MVGKVRVWVWYPVPGCVDIISETLEARGVRRGSPLLVLAHRTATTLDALSSILH